MVRYSWFYECIHRSQPETQEDVEQYTQGFLIYLLGTTLFVNRWNTGGTGLATLYGYMSSSSRMKGNKVAGYWRAWELSVYAYFLTLAPVLVDEIAPATPYSWRYDGRCRRRHRDDMTFAYYRRYFDMMVACKAMMPGGVRDQCSGSWATSSYRILLEGPFCQAWFLVVPTPPPASIRTTDSLPMEAIVQFMAGMDANFFKGDGDYATFI
ncbi:hypothetical protein CsSME_00031782 [Camellia sinensis var. sinensis]